MGFIIRFVTRRYLALETDDYRRRYIRSLLRICYRTRVYYTVLLYTTAYDIIAIRRVSYYGVVVREGFLMIMDR